MAKVKKTEKKQLFTENAEELRKIIKENIGENNQEVAIEFLDAIIENHNARVKYLQGQLESAKEDLKNCESEAPNFSFIDQPNSFDDIDYGMGMLIYYSVNINMKFQEQLRDFCQQWKENAGKVKLIA